MPGSACWAPLAPPAALDPAIPEIPACPSDPEPLFGEVPLHAATSTDSASAPNRVARCLLMVCAGKARSMPMPILAICSFFAGFRRPLLSQIEVLAQPQRQFGRAAEWVSVTSQIR